MTINSLVAAEVLVDGRLIGTTPVRFESPIGKKIEIVLRKNGYKDKRVPITVLELGNEYFEQLDKAH